MLVKVRENLFVADRDVTAQELKEQGVTVVQFVSGDQTVWGDFEVFVSILHTDKPNKSHVKDIACHIPKYMTQFGETVAVISGTGLVRAAYVVARAICELEQKSIYEVLLEMKEKIPGFDIGKAYI